MYIWYTYNVYFVQQEILKNQFCIYFRTLLISGDKNNIVASSEGRREFADTSLENTRTSSLKTCHKIKLSW